MKIFQAVLVAAYSLAAALSAQEAPTLQQTAPLRVTLVGPAIVTADAEVTLRLTVDVQRDAAVEAALVNGMNLTVRVDGKEATTIIEPGQGGAIQMVAGTRLERLLSFPVSALTEGVELQEMAVIAVAWKDKVGVDCSFKVAPDSSKVKLDELDLAKTQVILVTNYGEMQLGFRPDKAPGHVKNFLKLCLSGFYEGTKFHRVIRNFMIQGGCPNTKDDSKRSLWGRGNPGYKIEDELNDLRHLKGTLSMAHSGPNTGGSQFFIMHSEAPHLNGVHTAFGNVVSGIDVLDAIANAQVGGPQNSTPSVPVVLSAAVVLPVNKK